MSERESPAPEREGQPLPLKEGWLRRLLKVDWGDSPAAGRGRALGVENDVGGPTSVYRGSVQGITQIVQIAHNRQAGRPLGYGLPSSRTKESEPDINDESPDST